MLSEAGSSPSKLSAESKDPYLTSNLSRSREGETGEQKTSWGDAQSASPRRYDQA